MHPPPTVTQLHYLARRPDMLQPRPAQQPTGAAHDRAARTARRQEPPVAPIRARAARGPDAASSGPCYLPQPLSRNMSRRVKLSA